MRGHLHITASPDPAGETFLSAQSFCAPFHLSKPHRDEGALIVNVVNPTAGLFDGDSVETLIKVEAGARLVVTTPGAGRVFRARTERPAIMCQEIEVSAGGFAEYFPELFIPQGGARYHQKTVLRIAPGGQLLFCEWLAPGRVAHGEVFAYDELLWDTDIWLGEELIARERYQLTPRDDSLNALQTVSAAAHYLGFFVIGWPGWPVAELEALTGSDVYAGHGRLSAGGSTFKAVCADSLSARNTQRRVREILYGALGRTPPALRRY